jgi:hypothetical protein
MTREESFWHWFQKNEDALFHFEQDREGIFSGLTSEMHKVNPSLTFEFGPEVDNRREFTISADGIKQAFPEVEALYAAAPSLPRWKFIKFRQRHALSEISYKGITVKPQSVALRVVPGGAVVDITVFMKGYTQAAQETYTGIAFLFLDQALGEYDVETRVGQIRVDSISKAPAQTSSLQDLPTTVDHLGTSSSMN